MSYTIHGIQHLGVGYQNMLPHGNGIGSFWYGHPFV